MRISSFKKSFALTYIAAVAAAGLVGSTLTSKADLLAYEPFSGTDGNNVIGSSGGFGFLSAWSDANSAQTATGVGTFSSWNLGYVDSFGNALVTSPGSAFFQGNTTANSSWQGVRAFDFSRGTNGADGGWTWVSMLAIRTGPENAGANPYARGVNIVMDMTFGQTPPAGQLQKIGVGNGSGAAANTVAILSSGGNIRPSANPQYPFGGTGGSLITNFIVLGIQHVQDGLDNTYLWVNPTDLTVDLQANLGAATTNVLGVYDYSFDRLRVFVGGNNGAAQPYGALYLDEYRIGQTALDVMPVPEPTVVVLGGLGLLGMIMYRRSKQ